jgi:hypothetical protein
MKAMRSLWCSLGVVLLGCGSTLGEQQNDAGAPDVRQPVPEAGGRDASSDSHDAASDSPAVAGYPAAHPPMPQVKNLGGPVMKTPKFVIITFVGDTLAPSIDDFADKVAASKTYWSGTTAEYGVGPVASVLHLSVNETPDMSLADADVQTWLMGKLSGPDAGTLEGGAPWPQPDGETVYMIDYPSGVTISQGGGTSCMEFFGYHDDIKLSNTTYVTYSVVARCPPFPMTSAIDSITAIASHELIEATTDPLVSDDPAWAEPDTDHTAWEIPAGGELGDMCAGFGNVFYTPSDVPYLVQRSWSNEAAAASHDPCQPDGAMPYFNAAAVLNDSVTFSDPVEGTFTTKGITIPVGGTGTVQLDLYSDAPTSGPWTIQAYDLSSYVLGGPTDIELSFGGHAMATGKNGDTIQLDIKVLQKGTGGTEGLWIVSTLGQTQSYWVGLVGN